MKGCHTSCVSFKATTQECQMEETWQPNYMEMRSGLIVVDVADVRSLAVSVPAG
jgi:hypothetical protein